MIHYIMVYFFDKDFLDKKSEGDFLFKRRFFWCDPSTRAIHW